MRYRPAVMGSLAAEQTATAPADLACVALRAIAWCDPVTVAAPFADELHAAVLLSGADGWSYVLRRPDRAMDLGEDPPAAALGDVLGDAAAADPDGPPFQGGVLGLAAYELSARLEPTAPQGRGPAWPDLSLLRYPALLAFRERDRRAFAVGRGASPREAAARADGAGSWLESSSTAVFAGRLAMDADV
ncbi:MAG TPA: hypothetical protein VFH92_14075, partial [Phenylobacterium sp.]|nr:hypothetical protein [Phenylobacterium sp.]